MASDIRNFRMPRSGELPDIGLYLDQVVKYINATFRPLGCVEVTPSMVSNYVKKKYIPKPVKKLYRSHQIRVLAVIALAKLVLGMEDIDLFLKACDEAPVDAASYDGFAEKLETVLKTVFGETIDPDEVLKNSRENEISFIDSLTVAIAMSVYLSDSLEKMGRDGAKQEK